MDGLIIEHTEQIAKKLKQRFASDPDGEIDVWVSTAQQREAMVVQLYAGAAVEQRLPKSKDEPPIYGVVRRTVGGIWAQESSHTTLMRALRQVDGQRLADFQTLVGSVEGRTTELANSSGVLGTIARFAVSIGRALDKVPGFTQTFHGLNLREFCDFSLELETTAGQGYQRILHLIDVLDGEADDDGGSIKFGLTQRYEFAKTLSEERFHAAVFGKLRQWVTPDGKALTPIDAKTAVLELKKLADETLMLLVVKEVPDEARPDDKGLESAGDEAPYISDGGLGELFGEYGVGVEVYPVPGAVAH